MNIQKLEKAIADFKRAYFRKQAIAQCSNTLGSSIASIDVRTDANKPMLKLYEEAIAEREEATNRILLAIEADFEPL